MTDGSMETVTAVTPSASRSLHRAWVDLRHNLTMFVAMSFANVLDYGYNVLLGRLMSAEGYGILVALQAILRIVSVSLEIVRTETARHTVHILARARQGAVGTYLRTALGRAVMWGSVASLLAGLLSRPIARLLQIPSAGPVLVTAASLLPLTVKPVLGGVLQGAQRFAGLGLFHVVHAALRLVLGVVLVRAGLDALGAIAALPIGTTGTILLGLGLVWAFFRSPAEQAFESGTGTSAPAAGLSKYVSRTSIGLVGLAILVNMDALVVKHYAAPEVAGQYSMAVTLGKIVLFVPVAFAQVLFSKSAAQHAQARDSSRLVWMSQAMTIAPCAVLTAAYFTFPGPIFGLVFGTQNPFQGPVLGVLALAMSGYAVANVWLSYFLSVEQSGFVYTLPLALIAQLSLLVAFHGTLMQVVTVLAATSVGLSVAGGAWYRRRCARGQDG
jgi:O-antigen/teichoic acid export membrane protein